MKAREIKQAADTLDILDNLSARLRMLDDCVVSVTVSTHGVMLGGFDEYLEMAAETARTNIVAALSIDQATARKELDRLGVEIDTSPAGDPGVALIGERATVSNVD